MKRKLIEDWISQTPEPGHYQSPVKDRPGAGAINFMNPSSPPPRDVHAVDDLQTPMPRLPMTHAANVASWMRPGSLLSCVIAPYHLYVVGALPQGRPVAAASQRVQ